METLFSLRFFAAPILALVFVVAAVPDMAAQIFLYGSNDPAVASAGLFLLLSGFLVSSIATFLVNILSLDVINFKKDEIEELRAIFPFMHKELPISGNAQELAEWLLLDRVGGSYVRDMLQARWNYFMVSFNSYIALLAIVLPTIAYLSIEPNRIWWSVFVAFLVIFSYNSWSFFTNVNEITRFLVHKSKLECKVE